MIVSKVYLYHKIKRTIDMEALNFFNTNVIYNEKGLIPVIVQDHGSSEVLMMAWMNKKSLEETLKTKKMVYWSRSRNELWIKGQTSGNTQQLVDLRIDCDKDCLLALVNQVGPACHTNNITCFYRKLN